MQGAKSSCARTHPKTALASMCHFIGCHLKPPYHLKYSPRHLLFVDKAGEEFYFSLLKKNLDHIAFFVNAFFSSCFSKSPYFPRLKKRDVSKRHLKNDTRSRASLLRESATCYEPRYVDTKSKLCLSYKSQVPENTAQELLMVPASQRRLCRFSSEVGFQGVKTTGTPLLILLLCSKLQQHQPTLVLVDSHLANKRGAPGELD